MSTPFTRKGEVGQAGNPGQFAAKTHAEADSSVSLGADDLQPISVPVGKLRAEDHRAGWYLDAVAEGRARRYSLTRGEYEQLMRGEASLIATGTPPREAQMKAAAALLDDGRATQGAQALAEREAGGGGPHFDGPMDRSTAAALTASGLGSRTVTSAGGGVYDIDGGTHRVSLTQRGTLQVQQRGPQGYTHVGEMDGAQLERSIHMQSVGVANPAMGPARPVDIRDGRKAHSGPRFEPVTRQTSPKVAAPLAASYSSPFDGLPPPNVPVPQPGTYSFPPGHPHAVSVATQAAPAQDPFAAQAPSAASPRPAPRRSKAVARAGRRVWRWLRRFV